jgi:hypothetical protein
VAAAVITLRRDLPTRYGILAKGLEVQVRLVRNETAMICIDPPGPHIGLCHFVLASTNTLTAAAPP